ncbi:MAG: phenylalanyl-tRNA synthetase, beta subunit [Thermomicrobiales bacterium]|nr:phenylalanyl-tRNA synthetase, beta subunit [Thermomicrobiales bacterium]
MKVPLRWLNEFIDTGLSVKELTHRLTMAGLEAEKITNIGDEWANIFVGHVEAVERHPDADRLVLATVDAGEHRLRVVTGAPNIAQDQMVPLALAGARLIDGHADGQIYRTLKPSSIRGIRSEGMVCSEKELGLSEEHEGIMVLEADAPKGVPLAEWLGDTVIEFEITPNLVHNFSILGIAREAGALTDRPVSKPPIFDFAEAPSGPADLVTVEATDIVPRYVGVLIENITVEPSPAWMQRRLLAAGVRPINNIVDITNYVMLEYGQPLHAFDADKLAGGHIVVRRARPGETLETLDHQVRQLDDQMLVIADTDKAVGLAGVIGGLDSEIHDGTTRIILESANFDMKVTRRTARELKVRTDASARFERGLDPNLSRDAAARATRLILELSPGATVTGFIDVYPEPFNPWPLSLPFGEIERLLGVRYEPEQVLDVLRRLSFSPKLDGEGDDATLSVTVPTWRSDVTQAADIVEEVARVIGYDTLPERLPTGQTAPVQRDPVYAMRRAVRSVLTGAGAWETVTYVTVSDDDLRRLDPHEEKTVGVHPVAWDALIRLRNPLQADRDILRPTLLPSLLAIAGDNLKHERAVRLFETARVYLPSDDELPHEVNVLAIVLAGERAPLDRFTTGDQSPLDFFDLKGMVELLLERLGVTAAAFSRIESPALHPGRSVGLFVGERHVGILGELRPDRAEAFGIDAPRVAVAEIDLDALRAVANPVPRDVSAPRFLPVEQDFAIVVPEETPAGDVETALMAGAGPLATGVALFDIYRGPQIGENRKSLAYRVTFTAPDRALTDAELGKVRDRIARTLRKLVGGEIRT